jgi:hypothetical protein
VRDVSTAPQRTKTKSSRLSYSGAIAGFRNGRRLVGGPKSPLGSANAGLDYAGYWSECVLAVDPRTRYLTGQDKAG